MIKKHSSEELTKASGELLNQLDQELRHQAEYLISIYNSEYEWDHANAWNREESGEDVEPVLFLHRGRTDMYGAERYTLEIDTGMPEAVTVVGWLTSELGYAAVEEYGYEVIKLEAALQLHTRAEDTYPLKLQGAKFWPEVTDRNHELLPEGHFGMQSGPR